MSDEVNSLEIGDTVEVSVQTSVQAAPEQSPAAPSKPKRAPRPAPGTPEGKEYQRIKTAESRERKKKCELKEVFGVDGREIDDEEARQILIEVRKLRHPHVIETCIALAKAAAQALGLTFNDHLLRYGVQKTLETLKKDSADLLDIVD